MKLFTSMKGILSFILLFTLLPLMPRVFEKMKSFYSIHIDQRTAVGILPIKGSIMDAGYYIKQLNAYYKDEHIKAVLLKMDSPGGASGSSQLIYTQILALKEQYPHKPIITMVENSCASGAYYIACATDYIIAPPSSIIGSIGVRLENLFQLHELLKKYDIGYEIIKSGKYKATSNPFTTLTEEDKTLLQSLTDNCYEQFTHDVAQRRKLSLNSIADWADGKIFTGNQALKLRLIDQIGSYYHAEHILKDKARIETDIRWVHPPKKSKMFGLFGSGKEHDEDSMFDAFLKKLYLFMHERKNQLFFL